MSQLLYSLFDGENDPASKAWCDAAYDQLNTQLYYLRTRSNAIFRTEPPVRLCFEIAGTSRTNFTELTYRPRYPFRESWRSPRRAHSHGGTFAAGHPPTAESDVIGASSRHRAGEANEPALRRHYSAPRRQRDRLPIWLIVLSRARCC